MNEIDTVYLDMDGVLCDFAAGALKAHRRQFSELVPGVWDFAETLCIEPAAFWNALKGPSFWVNLRWMDDGRELLSLLERRFGQPNICLLTSPPLDPQSAAGKMLWIGEQTPAYRRQFMIGPKKEFCAGPGKLLVDDSPKNLDAFTKKGGRGLLVPRFWNEGHPIADRAVSVIEKAIYQEDVFCPTI